jgi:Domain of unknown function (DUF378)
MFRRRLTDELNRRDQLAGALLGLGALNWGLVGLANFDAVRAVLGKTARHALFTAWWEPVAHTRWLGVPDSPVAELCARRRRISTEVKGATWD